MSDNASATDSLAVSEEERQAQEAMIAAGAGEPGAMGGKPKNFWPSFRRFLGLLGPHAWVFGLATLLGAIGVVLSVAGPKILGEATNVVFEGVISRWSPTSSPASQEEVVAALESAGQHDYANMVGAMQNFAPGAGVDFEALRTVVIWAILVYVVGSLLQWVQGYIINVVMVRTMWRLREQIEQKINRLPLRYFDKVQRGELISRVTNDVDNMTQTLQQSLSGAITSLLMVVGVVGMMFSISWQLALVALVSLPLIGIIMGVIGPKSQKAFQMQWRKVGRLNSRVEESFSGHALVKVFGREKEISDAFRRGERRAVPGIVQGAVPLGRDDAVDAVRRLPHLRGHRRPRRAPWSPAVRSASATCRRSCSTPSSSHSRSPSSAACSPSCSREQRRPSGCSTCSIRTSRTRMMMTHRRRRLAARA